MGRNNEGKEWLKESVPTKDVDFTVFREMDSQESTVISLEVKWQHSSFTECLLCDNLKNGHTVVSISL